MTKRKYFWTTAALVLTLAGSAALAQQKPPAALTPAAKAHIDKVKDDGSWGPRLCDAALPASMRPKRPTLEEMQDVGAVPGQLQPPARVFDNLYDVGIRHVTAWAWNTPDGIVLIDALDNGEQTKVQVEEGLRKFGLDPARIKYIVIAHGHGDHYGGARYLQEKYHPRVMMSAADWDLAIKTPSDKADPPPNKDMVITDGQKLTLGGETMTLYITPGHTPGTVSMIFPVIDRGQRHVAALWGGTAPRDLAPYAASADRFMKIAQAAGADVALSNHPENDQARIKIGQLAKRGANDPNPFVVGKDGVTRFFTAYAECIKARMAAGPS